MTDQTRDGPSLAANAFLLLCSRLYTYDIDKYWIIPSRRAHQERHTAHKPLAHTDFESG